MARPASYRLDNVGKFYSAEALNSTQTVFRFSAELADEIDPDALQQALDRAVNRYPDFNVCLRNGFFWHYLEPATEMPQVQPENLPICFGLHSGPKSVLFRVSYFRQRINLEVSHIISDGRGTLGFFQELVGCYVLIRYGVSTPALETDTTTHQSEDGFAKYYQRKKAAPTPTQRAYRIRGLRDPSNPTYLEYHLPASKVHALAHSCDTTITSLIIAAVIYALCSQRSPIEANRPIRLTVPVDLRQFFEAKTNRNFFGLATVIYNGDGKESLEAIARDVQHQIKEAARAEQLEKRMNKMISLERNPFLRFAPLFLKDLVLELATRIAARDITSAVSSLGRISFGDETDRYVRSVTVLTSTFDLNFVVSTFEDDMSIGISTIYTDLSIVRTLCRLFSARGIYGSLNINKDRADIERDLNLVQLQDTVRQLADQKMKEDGHDALR